VRNADGIVSYKDCLDILSFSVSDCVFQTINWLPTTVQSVDDLVTRYYAYSPWLTIYKIIEFPFFDFRQNIVELLAGIIGLRLKVKSSYFYFCLQQVETLLSSYKQYPVVLHRLADNVDKYNEYSFYKDFPTHNVNGYQLKDGYIDHMLNTGFDEIFLLHMFRSVISVSCVLKYVNDTELQSRLQLQLVTELIDNNTVFLQFNELHYELIKSTIYCEWKLFQLTVDDKTQFNTWITAMLDLLQTEDHIILKDKSGMANLIIRLCHEYREKEYLMIIFDCLFHPTIHNWEYIGNTHQDTNLFIAFRVYNSNSQALVNMPMSKSKDIRQFERQVYIKSKLFRTLPTLYTQYLQRMD